LMSPQLFNPWMFKLFKIDPSYYFSKITCPLLALNGEKDTQVDYKSNLAIIQKYTKNNPNVTCESVPNVNHLFQTCETGLFDEYGEISQTFNPLVLQKISYWMNNLKLKSEK
ncbi:MAG: dienelactone hydrolase family protein, partial [Bacteroidales bacterium]|nr:dienelactone hydrolase family protein [Bacteroidales bacterium]